MPHELAAAAFVRGAVGPSAAEPWKAAVRFPAQIGISHPTARRHPFPSIPSASPADASHHRRSLTASLYRLEHASGREGLGLASSRHPNSLPTDAPRSRRFLVVAPSSAEKAWRHEGRGGAYFKLSATSLQTGSYSSPYLVRRRRTSPCRALWGTATTPATKKEMPQLGRLVKISLLCLVLLKMGLLVPKAAVDKKKVALNSLLLLVALLAGYAATKDHQKVGSLLKLCDGTMKFYKVLTEIADLLSAFFK